MLAEATTPVQTLSYARNPRVQVVLLDISWISADETSVREAGFDLLCKIRSARPGLPVLMYSIEADAECIERCRRLGADGYLIKGLDDGLLSFAVRAVHAGVQIWPTSCAGPHRQKLRRAVVRFVQFVAMTPAEECAMLPLAPDLAARVLDAAPDAMIVIDASGHIRFANRQVSVLFGYEHDELIGRNAELVMPERFRQRHMGHRESYANQVRVRPMGVGLELFGRQRDGKEFPVEISLSPIAERGQMLVAAAIRDVSDRKRAEFELIEAREAADRASQGKSRFLATASHDLRQPLQTLALLNGSLRRIVRDADADEALLQQEQAVRAMSRLSMHCSTSVSWNPVRSSPN